MIVLLHERRKIVQFDVTEHPTAAWLAQQVTEAFPWDTAPRYLRDRDASQPDWDTIEALLSESYRELFAALHSRDA